GGPQLDDDAPGLGRPLGPLRGQGYRLAVDQAAHVRVTRWLVEGHHSKVFSPIRTSSPGVAPASDSRRSTPARSSRSWRCATAWGLPRSHIATQRSTDPPVTRQAPSSSLPTDSARRSVRNSSPPSGRQRLTRASRPVPAEAEITRGATPAGTGL